MSWKLLDEQFCKWRGRLNTEVNVPIEAASKLATTIASDVRFLDPSIKKEIISADPVSITSRIEELQSFQSWMDFASGKVGNPSVIRAQVLCQNYICFVYLPEVCFKILAKKASAGSVVCRCSRYLTNNPVRAFRNAIAHGNWCYRDDFEGIEFWARKGDKNTEPVVHFEVLQEDLSFWQALSRCVAYVSYLNL